MTENLNTRVTRLENALALVAEHQAKFDDALERIHQALVVLITAQTKLAEAQTQDRIGSRKRDCRLDECIVARLPTASLRPRKLRVVAVRDPTAAVRTSDTRPVISSGMD